MKRTVIVMTCLLSLVLVGCGQEAMRTKPLHVVIPEHPWERNSTVRLWYTLKWNDNGKIQSLYVDTGTREVDIKVPRNCTVYICAYPLGEMTPWGTAIVPTSNKREVVLTQSEGYVAHLLINSNIPAAERVNFDLLYEKIMEQTFDTRSLDDTALVADVINGKLNKRSVEIKSKYRVESISIPNGKWVPESEIDRVLYVNSNHTGELEFYPGVYRYYCEELDREFRVVVDHGGAVFSSLRYGMTGL